MSGCLLRKTVSLLKFHRKQINYARIQDNLAKWKKEKNAGGRYQEVTIEYIFENLNDDD